MAKFYCRFEYLDGSFGGTYISSDNLTIERAHKWADNKNITTPDIVRVDDIYKVEDQNEN